MDEQVTPPAVPPVYKDEDLVYVNPETRTVVGFVEWTNTGKPKALAMKMEDEEEDDALTPTQVPAGAAAPAKRIRKRRQRYYPWGTYRSMKRIYKIEGKVRHDKDENRKTLDEVLEKALKEPFWD